MAPLVVNHVLRSLPLFVVSEILGHVVKVVLFLGQRYFKDVRSKSKTR
jgi:hypothetical protein